MKRLHQSEIDAIAAAVVRNLICRHGLVNLGRLRLAIRREVRNHMKTSGKNILQNLDFAVDNIEKRR